MEPDEDEDAYLDKSASAGRMGKAVEYLVAAACILSTRGELNVSTSMVDDEGVDLVFHRRDSSATLAVQVKARMSLPLVACAQLRAVMLGDRQVERITAAESELGPPGHLGCPCEALARDVEHGRRVAYEDVERPLRAPPGRVVQVPRALLDRQR